MEQAWTAIHSNWQSYQFTILSIADYSNDMVMFQSDIAGEIERRRAAAHRL